MYRYGVAIAALSGLAAEARAQSAGALELGLFGNVAYFDRTLRLDQGSAGPGARLGFFITDNWMIEGEGSWTPTDVAGGAGFRVSYIPLRGRIAYNFRAGESTSLILGGGYAYTMYRDDADFEDSGPTASAGIRMGEGGVAAIRLNFYVDYIPSPESGVKENWNWGIQPGLNFIFGGRGAGTRDRDKDGVPDQADECRDTPAGDRVDARGCTVKDADGDGVLDDADKCADTPAGEQVDASGCPLPKDADGDKVADPADKCPDTPAGETVDQSGCSASQRDTDGDKVNDAADKCADTPGGEQVDASGCPLPKDGDGDGVNDGADRCPSTPSGVQVDAEGCQVLFEEKKKTLILEGVNFETGKADLTSDSEAILNAVAEALVANEEVRVQVSGHTDNTGSAAVNKRLSRARADAVRQYLVDRGVAADRLTAAGFGPSRPVASNRTAEGRAQNRRVELQRLN